MGGIGGCGKMDKKKHTAHGTFGERTGKAGRPRQASCRCHRNNPHTPTPTHLHLPNARTAAIAAAACADGRRNVCGRKTTYGGRVGVVRGARGPLRLVGWHGTAAEEEENARDTWRAEEEGDGCFCRAQSTCRAPKRLPLTTPHSYLITTPTTHPSKIYHIGAGLGSVNASSSERRGGE
jgi:hypothetical protein